jgi:hypothetical protein
MLQWLWAVMRLLGKAAPAMMDTQCSPIAAAASDLTMPSGEQLLTVAHDQRLALQEGCPCSQPAGVNDAPTAAR